MEIKTSFSKDTAFINSKSWDIAFVGSPVDDRGKTSIEFLSSKSSERIVLKYFPQTFKVEVNGDFIEKDNLDLFLSVYKKKSIIIDSTTLGFSELLILCQGLKDNGFEELSILYLESGDYRLKQTNQILSKRDFELSGDIIGYEAIPGHALAISNENVQKIVFLCGFESERIDRAFEDSEINQRNCSCIFGVPAICAGWEMDSFVNNLTILKDRKLARDINFCGATNPEAIVKKLEEYYSSLDDNDQMFVVPLATKPMSIGACLFVLSKPKDKVAVLYDHPIEISNRSTKIVNWHLYEIKN
jgi:hypothetical protein